MTNLRPTKAIIDNLSKDPRFKSICKKIAKRPHLADDLYQEFFLALCEIKDKRLTEAEAGGYLDVLCVGIIHNIWGKRYRVKTYACGETSPLYEVGINFYSLVPFDENHSAESFNGFNFKKTDRFINESFVADPAPEYDFTFDTLIEKATEEIERAKNSDDESVRFRARVFEYSHLMFKSPRQFSIKAKIPYNLVLQSHNQFKAELQQCLR